jgi:hypothetical protein
MWTLGFATALILDGLLFDGFPLWQGVPILAGLAAMTAMTARRHRKDQP